MEDTSRRAAADMRRLLDRIASRTSSIKLAVEAVQCIAIDARLTLMEEPPFKSQDWLRHTREDIASRLDVLRDEIDTLLAEFGAATRSAERVRLQ
jgi:hypothetical protein